MLLKRLYENDPTYDSKIFPEGGLRVKGIRVLRAGPRQCFSTRFVEKALAEGWLSISAGKITINAENGAFVYRIERAPGYYCCHCQEAVDNGPTGAAHVAAVHGPEPMADPANPLGYRHDNFYACIREEEDGKSGF